MGNVAIRRRLLHVINAHLGKFVKSVPSEDELWLSLCRGSLRLSRVQLEERLLENLKAYLPITFKEAVIGDLLVRLGPTSITVSAQSVKVHGVVRRQEEWVKEKDNINHASACGKSQRLSDHARKCAGLHEEVAGFLKDKTFWRDSQYRGED